MHREVRNVVVLEDSGKVSFGGGQRGTLEIIDVLQPHYRIHLFDTTTQSIFYEKAQQKVEVIHQLRGYGKIVGGKKAAFSIGIKEILTFPYYVIVNVISLARFFRDEKLNRYNTIIYTSCKKPLVFASILHAFFKIRYIYHARNYYDRTSPFYRFLRIIVRNAAQIICVSQTVKDNLAVRRSTVIHNPMRINAVTVTNKSIRHKSKITVAVFASLIPWKGIEYFMQSFPYLKYQDNVYYRVYGKGGEHQNLLKYTNDHVQLLGFAEDTETILKDEVDLVCVPSIAEEAFGRVSVEGYKFGIPAITTDIGGQREINISGHVGVQVPIKNPRAIAEQVDYFIENPDTYEKFSANALVYVKKFDFQLFKKHILLLFKTVFAE